MRPSIVRGVFLWRKYYRGDFERKGLMSGGILYSHFPVLLKTFPATHRAKKLSVKLSRVQAAQADTAIAQCEVEIPARYRSLVRSHGFTFL